MCFNHFLFASFADYYFTIVGLEKRSYMVKQVKKCRIKHFMSKSHNEMYFFKLNRKVTRI